MTPLSPTYRRSDDHGAKARENTNDPRGAPYYLQVRERIRQHDMKQDRNTAQMFLALGAMVMLAPHIHELVAICCALYMFYRIYKLDND